MIFETHRRWGRHEFIPLCRLKRCSDSRGLRRAGRFPFPVDIPTQPIAHIEIQVGKEALQAFSVISLVSHIITFNLLEKKKRIGFLIFYYSLSELFWSCPILLFIHSAPLGILIHENIF